MSFERDRKIALEVIKDLAIPRAEEIHIKPLSLDVLGLGFYPVNEDDLWYKKGYRGEGPFRKPLSREDWKPTLELGSAVYPMVGDLGFRGAVAHELGHYVYAHGTKTPWLSSSGKRQDEFMADSFALENGYGPALLAFFAGIKQTGYPTHVTSNSHPSIDARIQRIERRLELWKTLPQRIQKGLQTRTAKANAEPHFRPLTAGGTGS